MPTEIPYVAKPKITTLDGRTEYVLYDGRIYSTVLVADVDFVLPDITDLTILHEIIVTCKFNGQYYARFKDGNGVYITPMDTNYWDVNDVVQYLCRYEPLLSKWVIMQMKLY
jgi:hypothetical protein